MLVNECPLARRVIPLTLFKGKRVAVDANGVANQSVASVWADIVNHTKYPDEQPDMNKFMVRLLRRLKRDLEVFLIAGVTPVYVFDGKSPPEKINTRAKRDADRRASQDKYQKIWSLLTELPTYQHAPHVEELRKEAKKLFPCNSEVMGVIREFYGVMGLPVIQCNEEAERLCAQLCLSGYCSATFSKDTDTLVHGCPIVMIEVSGNIMYQGKSVPAVEIYDLYELLLGLNVSFAEFKDICIMHGCDYNRRIGQVGPTKIRALMSTYGSIANIPISALIKYFTTHVKRNPDDGRYLGDPKALLNVNDCYNRFAPIDPVSLISETDMENDILNNLSLDTRLTIDAGTFLASYQLEEMLKDIVTLYSLHPSLSTMDIHNVVRPDISFCNWARLVVGSRYSTLWGV